MAEGPKLEKPQLPENIGTLPKEEQSQAYEFYQRQLLFFCYRVLASRFNTLHHTALLDRMLLVRKLLVEYASRQWTGNNFTLRGAIIRIVRFWDNLPDAKDKPCPLHFDDAELLRFDAQEEEWTGMNTLMEDYRRRGCNMSEEGWVRNEDFERGQEEIRKMKEEALLQCDGDADDERIVMTGWPFRDHDEED